MRKYRYKILNLDCANCAREIEEYLNKDKYLNNVVVNFNTKKISFESDKEFSLKEINDLVKKIEPDASVTNENEVKQTKEYHYEILICAIILSVIGMYIILPSIINEILILIAYILLLYKPLLNSIKLLIKSKTINENLLIVTFSVGAYLIGDKMEGLMVVALYILGKILEEKAINNTRREVRDLLDIKQDYANKLIDKEIKK